MANLPVHGGRGDDVSGFLVLFIEMYIFARGRLPSVAKSESRLSELYFRENEKYEGFTSLTATPAALP